MRLDTATRAPAGWAGTIALLFTVGLLAVSPGPAAAATPSVTFDATPAADTNQTSATFAFHATSGGQSALLECSLDSAAFTSCTSPAQLSNLAEGQHSFSARTSGVAPGSPATYTWTVDLTPPTTEVTAQPPSLTNSTTATFAFTSPDPTAAFRCSLNGSPPQPCASPVVYTGLADGTRSLLIQAVDRAGNVDPLAQPITWTVDTTPPDTTLAKPGNLVAQHVAVFQFTSTEAGATFQCSFGTAAFATCTSPDVVSVFGSRAQVFKVRAVDPAGNVDPTPAVYRWTSDLTPPKRPNVTIFAAPSASAARAVPLPTLQKVQQPGLTFTNPLAKLLRTPTFTLALRLHAQWSSDATATSFDVTVDSFPQDSTGMGTHGEDVDSHREYSHTRRTALTLKLYAGTTVCVKVVARDKVGNISRPKTACTTIPISFTPRDVGPPPVRDARAWRGYYIRLGGQGYEFVQDIGDEFFFSPRRAALVAERCPHCGTVEFDFMRYGQHARLHELATVDLNGADHSGDFNLITVALPVRRLEDDGEGLLVIRAAAGRPRIAGIALTE
jgi:hypothetical protein